MKKISYKDFINISKFVTEFKTHSIWWRIKFYIESPFRYLIFKKVYKEELKNKIERKEVK